MGDCVSLQQTQTGTTKNANANEKDHDTVQRTIDGMLVFQDEELRFLIIAYFHFGGNQCLCNNDDGTDLYLPDDIIWMITTFKLYDLIIDARKYCILESGVQYNFSNIHLQEYSGLTVNAWDLHSKEGGILWLDCSGTITMEKGACINLSGKGYLGSVDERPLQIQNTPGLGLNLADGEYQVDGKNGFRVHSAQTHAQFLKAFNNDDSNNNNNNNGGMMDEMTDEMMDEEKENRNDSSTIINSITKKKKNKKMNNNRNYQLWVEHKLKVSDGVTQPKFGGNGGGCIRIACSELVMKNGANIMALGDASYTTQRRRRNLLAEDYGCGGLIELCIRQRFALSSSVSVSVSAATEGKADAVQRAAPVVAHGIEKKIKIWTVRDTRTNTTNTHMSSTAMLNPGEIRITCPVLDARQCIVMHVNISPLPQLL